jgi:hypothetical protein
LLSPDNFSIQCPKTTSNVILWLPSYARGQFWHLRLAWQRGTSSAGSLFAKELPACPTYDQTNKQKFRLNYFVEFRQFLHSVSKNHLECYFMAPLLCTWAVLAFSAGLADLYILGWVAICKGTACLPHLCIACGRADPAAYVCARLPFSAQ